MMTDDDTEDLDDDQDDNDEAIWFFRLEGDEDDIKAVDTLLEEHSKEDEGVDVESLARTLGCDTESGIFQLCKLQNNFFAYGFTNKIDDDQPLYQILNAICKKFPSLKYEVD